MRVPRLENGELSGECPPRLERFRLWVSANVHVEGRPTWVFVKLHTHGLIERHWKALLGDSMKQLLEELVTSSGDGNRYQIHFVSAREAANIIFAAVDGRTGDPGKYRNYRYVPLTAN